MKKSIMKRWVKALRSGKYEQGTKALRNANNQFCCLGVLCDLSKKELHTRWKLALDGDTYRFKNQGGLLSNEVIEWSGIRYENAWSWNSRGYRKSLIYLNDNGWSFKNIANFIEKNWKNL